MTTNYISHILVYFMTTLTGIHARAYSLSSHITAKSEWYILVPIKEAKGMYEHLPHAS